MTRVVVTNDNIDSAWKKFKVKFARSGVPSALKDHKCYTKPGVKRRKKKEEQIRNAHKRHKKRD